MVPKHRRSENPPLAPVGSPVHTGEFEAVGYDQAVATAVRANVHTGVVRAGNGYPAPDYYEELAAEPDWVAELEGQSRQDWHAWEDWGPPPVLHPDHPSAPVPRVYLPDDHPSGPMAVPRALAPPGRARAGGRPSPPSQELRPLPAVRDTDGRSSRGPAVPTPRDPGRARSSGRHAAVRSETVGYVAAASAGAAAGQMDPDVLRFRREANGYQRETGLPRREANGYQRETGLPRRQANNYSRQSDLPRRDSIGYQRQTSLFWQETTDYRRETGPFGPGPGPAQSAQEAQEDAAAIREAAEREAAAITQQATSRADVITQQATSRADVITQQATGQAAAIRGAAEQEAAELRARIESILGELNRATGYVAEGLAPSATPAIAPAHPGARPDLPGKRPGPATAPDLPGARPDLPAKSSPRPATKTARPDRPGTKPGGPAKQTATPTKMGQAGGQRPTAGRQRRAARIVMAGTAALLSVALVGAVTYTGIHGFSFFVFRESGQGETPGSFKDANFIAGQKECPGAVVCPPAHHTVAPTGKHHKTSAQTTSATK